MSANPTAVFAERDYLLGLARGGGPMGLAALKVLAALSASGTNYRGKLVAPMVRVLGSEAFADKDLPRWLATVAPAVEGSPEGLRRLELDLQPRLERLNAAERKRVDRLLLKLSRSTKRKR